MGQKIINTGNIANDGTGAPLRTAFTDTNYNFTQLFSVGPTGSNIVIANNSITVTNTNGNLRLATNGVGVIVPAANFVPDVPNVRSIGLGTNRFSTIYSQYINAATGTFSGNVYVAGNLQVTGNVVTVDYSNLSVANSNITLATGAANAAQADGGGLLIPVAGANFTYNYSANSWNSTIAITAPTFIGDGANLTNVIANVQAINVQGSILSNSVNYSNLTNFGLVVTISATGDVSTTGNVYANVVEANTVTANYLAGNGSNITNITANAIVGNVPFAVNANTAYVANLAALATQAINADTALFAINANLASWANTATTAQTANTAHYAIQADNANSAAVAGFAYNLIPTGNISLSGNITAGNLITSNIYVGNTVLTNSITNGNSVWLFNSNGQLTIPGNWNILGSSGNAFTISNNSNVNIWTFGQDGNLTIPGNLNAASVSPVPSINGFDKINAVTFSASGNISSNSLTANGVVYAGIDGQLTTSNSMTFADVGGEMTLTVDYFSTSTVFTNDILGSGNSINVSAQYGNSVLFDTTGGISATGNVTAANFTTSGTQGNITGANVISAVTLTASGNVYGMEFVTTNTSINDGVSTTGNIIGGNITTAGLANLYAINISQSISWPYGSQIYEDGGLVLQSTNMLAQGNNTVQFEFNDGAGNSSGLYADINESIVYSGVNVVIRSNNSGSQTDWVFDDTGTLTIPGNIVGNGASPAPSINGFDTINSITVSASGNVTGNYILGNGSQLTDVVATEPYFTIQVSNFETEIGARYGVNTTGGVVVASLPALPPTGGAIYFADAGGAYETNNLIIDPNGQTIMSSVGNMAVSTNNQSFGLFYNGSTWRVYI